VADPIPVPICRSRLDASVAVPEKVKHVLGRRELDYEVCDCVVCVYRYSMPTAVVFNFIRADMLRDDAQRKSLETNWSAFLSSKRSIKKRKPDWLVRAEVSDLQACQHALVGKYLAVSHCWESPETPDLESVQLEQIVK
jgi:hypothetical protein